MVSSVAIITFDKDPHAHAVAWGLEQLGHHVEFLYFHCLENFHKITLEYVDGKMRTSIANLSKPLEDFDTIWVRRVPRVQPSNELSEADAALAKLEWEVLQRSILVIAKKAGCFLVNPDYEKNVSGLKPVQLIAAQSAGFKIPHTVITNDHKSVSKLLDEHREVMFKVFGMPSWKENNDVFEFGTSLISNIDGLADDIAASPGIFQNYVEKKFEVRAVVFGRCIFCFKILSQLDSEGAIDWRRRKDFTSGIVSIIETPVDVRAKIFDVMDSLNIHTGSFDFIVSDDGLWTFLEVNPTGQFLWLEGDLPQVPLLDTFCKFLVSGRDDFEQVSENPDLRFSDFHAVSAERLRNEPQLPYAVHPYVLN